MIALGYLALGFLNPALLWALPLLAVPIVIHLLNRRRFDTRAWAAMEYLLAALKRNRKRIFLEQWIVLLLRTLAVALLVFLVARPQVSESMLGAQRTHHVFLLDDSASQGQREGANSKWDKAKELVAGRGNQLAEAREGDLVTLLRGSRATVPELLAARAGPQLAPRLREALAAAPLSDEIADLGELVREGRKRVAEAKEASRAEYWLVTDFRAVDWFGEDQKARSALANELMQLDPQREALKVVVVGGRDVENVAITDVRRAGRIAVAGVPVELQVELRNQGLETSPPCELSLEIDGGVRSTRNVEPIGPEDTRVVSFVHTFLQPGWHGVVATLPADRFPTDDRRAFALEVREHSKVLLVDGSPGDGGEDSETYYLSAALEPGGDARSGIATTVIAEHSLAETELAEFDMVWLCNAGTLQPAVVERLEAYVAGGGGLAVFLGDQVDPVQYGALLWKDGKGLLPAPLGELTGDPDKPENLFVADKAHPLLAVGTEYLERILSRQALTGRWFATEPPARTRVVLRVRDGSGPPLLLTSSYGRGGEVVLCATTADSQWTNLPGTYAYLVLANEMHRFAARAQDDGRHNQLPGGRIVYELDAATHKPDVLVRALTEEGEERTFTPPAAPAEGAAAQSVTVPMRELQSLGLFEARVALQAGPVDRRLFARNVPPVEGRLRRAAGADVFKAYPPGLEERLQFVDAETLVQGLGQSPRSDLWRALAIGLVVALLLETLLAWRFGGRK